VDWYYVKDGERVGPVTDAQIRELIGSSQLTSDDFVWKPGLEAWKRASEIESLFLPPQLPRASTAETESPKGIGHPVDQPPEMEDIQTARVPQQRKLPTRWLTFWTYFLLICGVCYFVLIPVAIALRTDQPSSLQAVIIGTTLLILYGIFAIGLALGLKRRRAWGWKANWLAVGLTWFALAAKSMSPVMSKANLLWSFGSLAFGLVWWGVLWMLPNFIYFRKRRALFS
jgi:hypothetical protein